MKLDHPCRDTCSGWQQGYERGQSDKEKEMITNNIMEFFSYEHLPEDLQTVSKPVGELARKMESELPHNAEKAAGLRKLLEAKDCFVRAKIYKGPTP